jgi:hypothetical protein
MNNGFIWFPSYSCAGIASELKTGYKLKNELSTKFYSDEFPEQFRYKYFLLSAGANYRNKEARKAFGLSNDVLVLGDSGGFQIKTGNLNWKPELRETILRWSENNTDVFMNLDIPPGGDVFKEYDECLDISAENFRYYADNRDNENTDILNVLQATYDNRTQEWYDTVKEFKFDGWSIGGIAGSKISSMLYAIAILLEGKEHLKSNNKWLHMLGTAKVSDFLILEQLQKSLLKVGSNMQVTTDSSSPDYAVVFGGYYMGFSLKQKRMESINLPKREDIFNNELSPPYVVPFDDILSNVLSYKDIFEWNRGSFAGLSLHNTYVQLDCIRKMKEIVNSHDGLISQVVGKDFHTLLLSIDEMVNSVSPMDVYKKYELLYLKLSNPRKEPQIKTHLFF